MPTYTVKDPTSGKTLTLQGDSPPSEQELNQIFSSVSWPQKQGLMSKAWQMAGVPEQMSRRGLGMIANMIPGPEPTGNKFRDIALNTPKIAAETLAEAAPGFISRGALATSALGPLVSKTLGPIGRAIAPSLEDWAGIKPGTLTEAAKDPTLIFAKGTKAAKPYYQAAQEEIEQSPLISKTFSNMRLIRNAEKMAKAGRLSSAEALEARKAADVLRGSKTVNQTWLLGKRKLFDAIAKGSEDIASGDVAYARGVKAQSLRSLFPKNVGGRASPFKVGEAMALSHFGPLGKLLSAAFSPLALGSAATGLGVASRIAENPAAAMTATQVLRRFRKPNENSSSQ